jgi:hypothetical protein
VSKQDLLDALKTPRAMDDYLEANNASEIIADIRAVMQPERTLRDWFAGQALAGLLANRDLTWPTLRQAPLASTVYQLADAMLAAREAGDE